MSLRNPLIETWQEKFNRTFKFHPEREAIMEQILGDEPISVSQMDRWFREADECADNENQKRLQNMEEVQL
jgi:nicotinamide riboside kinase